jgi:hypothetical protein
MRQAAARSPRRRCAASSRWKAALRTDYLHRLDIGDIATTDDGLLVHLRRSKTDQTGTGGTIAITTTNPDDPLDAVAAWVRWRNRLASHVLHTGPAWRAIDRYGRRPRPTRLTPKSLDAISPAAPTPPAWSGTSADTPSVAASPPPRWPAARRSGPCNATAAGAHPPP